MTAYNKIGFLTAVAGNPTGIGDYVKALDKAGIPAVCMCNDGTVGIMDALELIKAGSKVPHVLAHRVVNPDDKKGVERYSVPDYTLEPSKAARQHWSMIKPEFPPELVAVKEHVWFLPVNEVRAKRNEGDPQYKDMNAWDWMGEFCYELAQISRKQGFKVALPQANSGEPAKGEWKQPGMRKYLELCAEYPDFCAVGLHEYSKNVNHMKESSDHMIGRFQWLFAECDEMKINRPNVLIGEWGWEKGNVPGRQKAIEHIHFAASLYAKYPTVLGAGMWYLGEYQDNIDDKTQKLIKPVTDYTLSDAAKFPDPDPDPRYEKGTDEAQKPADPKDKTDSPKETNGKMTPKIDSGAAATTGEAPPASDLAAISRQIVEWNPGSQVKAVRIIMKRRHGDKWLTHTMLTESLDVNSRVEIEYLSDLSDAAPRQFAADTFTHLITQTPPRRKDPATGTVPKHKRKTPRIPLPPPIRTGLGVRRLLGMDVSYAQGKKVNFQKAADAGVKYCFIRAGSGRTFKDPNYERQYRLAGEAGMLRGIYFYLYPKKSATIGKASDRTPEAQARRFVSLLKDDAELGAVLDIEQKHMPAKDVRRFVDEFQKHDPYNRLITIYTAAWYWTRARGYSVPAMKWAAKHPLWTAHYTSSTKPIIPGKNFKVWIPPTWKRYTFHQWTAKGGSLVDHVTEDLDLIYFDGSLADLKKWSRLGD